MRKTIVVLLIMVLCLGCISPLFAEESSTKELSDSLYEYEVLPSDAEWKELEVIERIRISNIPIEYATSHSTRAILYSLLNCPFISNIYYYNTPNEGIEIFRKGFPSMDAFLQRNDALTQLTIYKNDFEKRNTETVCEKESREFFKYIIVCDLIEYYLEKCEKGVSYFVDPITGWQATMIQTPNGTNVVVHVGTTYEDHNTTSYAAHQVTLDAVINYNAEIIRNENPSYNCHAYAWYSTSYTNYWMLDPSAYMTDGSYVNTPIASPNHKVTYKNGTNLIHSGIVDSINGGFVTVVSKWGAAGLIRHTLTSNPYYLDPILNATNIQFWYEN